MKYGHFRGQANRRVDELLMVLSSSVTDFHLHMEKLYEAGRIKRKEGYSDEKARTLAEEMLAKGWESKCSVVTKTKWLIQSSSDPSRKHEVDLILVLCTCIAAPRLGMCKHYHVALRLSAARYDIDIEEERQVRALQILAAGLCFVDGPVVECYDTESDAVGLFRTDISRCLCIAASHGILCVCARVAALVPAPELVPDIIEDTDDVEMDAIPAETGPVPAHPVLGADVPQNLLTPLEVVQNQLGDLLAYSSEAMTEQEAKKIQPLVQSLHDKLFCSYKKEANKDRKIKPLHPYRNKFSAHNDHQYNDQEDIFRSTKMIKLSSATDHEHGYCSTSQSTSKEPTLPDGSKRMACRAKRTVRTPFEKE